MRFSILSLFLLLAPAAAAKKEARHLLVDKLKEYVKNENVFSNNMRGSKSNNDAGGPDRTRHLAAMTDIKQIMVPENASKLKTFINALGTSMAANPHVTKSMTKAMAKVQETIVAGESDQEFARRFAAMHLSNAVRIPNSEMQEGLRRLQLGAFKEGGPPPPTKHSDPHGPSHAEEEVPQDEEETFLDVRLGDGSIQDMIGDGDIRDIIQSVQRFMDFMERVSSSEDDSAIGAQQTRDEWFLLLFSIGLVIWAILPQLLPAQFKRLPPAP